MSADDLLRLAADPTIQLLFVAFAALVTVAVFAVRVYLEGKRASHATAIGETTAKVLDRKAEVTGLHELGKAHTAMARFVDQANAERREHMTEIARLRPIEAEADALRSEVVRLRSALAKAEAMAAEQMDLAEKAMAERAEIAYGAGSSRDTHGIVTPVPPKPPGVMARVPDFRTRPRGAAREKKEPPE